MLQGGWMAPGQLRQLQPSCHVRLLGYLPAYWVALSPLARDQPVLMLYVGDRQTSERPSMQQRTPTSFTRLSFLK